MCCNLLSMLLGAFCNISDAWGFFSHSHCDGYAFWCVEHVTVICMFVLCCGFLWVFYGYGAVMQFCKFAICNMFVLWCCGAIGSHLYMECNCWMSLGVFLGFVLWCWGDANDVAFLNAYIMLLPWWSAVDADFCCWCCWAEFCLVGLCCWFMPGWVDVNELLSSCFLLSWYNGLHATAIFLSVVLLSCYNQLLLVVVFLCSDVAVY